MPNAQIDAVTTAAPYMPNQIIQGYGFNRVIFQQGSNYYLGNGAGQTIAIVDAFNDASIISNINSFDSQFGLQAFNVAGGPTFKVLNQTGGTSLSGVTSASSNSSATYGWSIEESLDVEYAHTIAPDANIVLFEANSNSNVNLYTADETAAKAATYTQYGLPPAGVVSNSWGGGESKTEISSDADFTSVGNTVTFVFSSGDSHPVEYPSTSPNVLAVGGTSLKLTTSGFGVNYNGEGWYDTSRSNAGGGGSSVYEAEPSYQLGVQSSGFRTTPDVAMNGDGYSDVIVLDTNYPFAGYYGVYGTSEAAPMMSATLAIVDQGLTLAEGTFTTLGNAQAYVYNLPLNNQANPAYHETLNNSTSPDSNGLNNGVFDYLSRSGRNTITTTYTATPGYNTLTGLGSPIPTSFIPDMINYALAHGAHPVDPNGVWGDPNGASEGGNDDPVFINQTSGDFAQGGHLAVSPLQTAQSPLRGNAVVTQTEVNRGSAQPIQAFSPSAISAALRAVDAVRAGNNLDATTPSPLATDWLLTANGSPQALQPLLDSGSTATSSGTSLTPERVGSDSASNAMLPDDTFLGSSGVLKSIVPSLPGADLAGQTADPTKVPALESSAQQQPGAGLVDRWTDPSIIAALGLVMGNSWTEFVRREKRTKKPALQLPE